MSPVGWRELRASGRQRLREVPVDDPDQEIRWIIEQATGRTAAAQTGALDEPATDREARHFTAMVNRRVAGEPLQYVLGRWGFRTLDLLVDRRVLIPRPETEGVAELALDALAAVNGPMIAVDLGTGSGAIALSLAAECWPHIELWATDVSADALAVARANLAALGRRAAGVRLELGSWYAALPPDIRGRVDVIVSNPPYVAAGEVLPAEVADWEPRDALVSGPGGLEHIEVIVSGAGEWLTEAGVLVVEIGETQGPAVVQLAAKNGFGHATVHPDLAGRPRALVARR